MKELNEAIRILKDDNLVWDNDFEQIRKPLANLLYVATQFEYHHIEEQLDDLTRAIVAEKPTRIRWTEEDGELEIPNPVEEWDEQTRREYYIYQALASQSKSTLLMLRKLFRNL